MQSINSTVYVYSMSAIRSRELVGVGFRNGQEWVRVGTARGRPGPIAGHARARIV